VNGSTYTVSLGNVSERFTKSGTTFTPVSNNGSQLRQVGAELFFTLSDGTVATYSTSYSGSVIPYQAHNAALVQIKAPNGLITKYHWEGKSRCIDDFGPNCEYWVNYVRLNAISSSTGYQINFLYETNDPNEETLDWSNRVGAVGFNRAVEFCPEGDIRCPITGAWPRVTYVNHWRGPSKVTDQDGRITQYTYGSHSISGVRYPGSTSDDITVSTDSSERVTAVTNAMGTWNYAYSDAGGSRTTTATGPLGQSMTVVSNQAIGRATSVTERVSATPAVSRTTSYTYDAQRRLKRVTQPEGDYGELTYDARGNVTQVLHAPKPGTVLANITTSAVYPATCANPVTCNQPTSTTDALGNTTNYTYDATHGGVLTMTAPTPTGGAPRPQTRIAYALQTAGVRPS